MALSLRVNSAQGGQLQEGRIGVHPLYPAFQLNTHLETIKQL